MRVTHAINNIYKLISFFELISVIPECNKIICRYRQLVLLHVHVDIDNANCPHHQIALLISTIRIVDINKYIPLLTLNNVHYNILIMYDIKNVNCR